jgi:CHAD domain-containing protein
LRIACKKFRYATEVFVTALPETFQSELYPQLQELQSVLGDIQDAAAATRELLEERSELEGRLVLWLGLESGPGAEVRDAEGGIDGAVSAYATQAAVARRTLRDIWDGFVRSKFFEPMGEMLKA